MLSDTSFEAQAMQDEILRKLMPEQRLEITRQLTLGIQRLAFAALRQQNPGLTDDEIWMELAVRRLGPDLVSRIYGRGVGVS